MPNKPRHVFLDFDGTLIDPRWRLYGLFQELVPQSQLDFAQYWEIKRKRTDQQKLLSAWFSYTPDQIAEFKKNWMSGVEEEHRLLSDKPLNGVDEILSRMVAGGCRLSLVTARQKPELVEKQLARFGWTELFDNILVTRQSETKVNLVRQNVLFTPDDIFVGDTGEDIRTAKELGLKSVAVASGFLSAEILREYNPDFICESVVNIYETGLL